jgi:cell division protein FtsB
MNRVTSRNSRLPRLATPLLLLAALLGALPLTATAATEKEQLAELQRQLAQVQATLQQLADENRALRQHQQDVDQQLAQLHATPAPALAAAAAAGAAAANASALPAGSAAPAPALAANESAAPANSAALPPGPISSGATFGSPGSGLRLWGYGEIYYSNPVDQREQTKMDLARAVVGIGYRFDDLTEFNSEYEVEHAVASADDVGEFEVEQFYVDRRLSATSSVTARAGLFLMPFGFINEHHEPTNFYGVERNFVETLIIPSTWREGGLSFRGDAPFGLTWQAGVTTGINLSAWDFGPEFPPYRTALELQNSGIAPLQATHQELSLADARHLSEFLALSYYGVPGLNLGAAISSGKATSAGAGDPRVTLWEAHARWTPAKFDLSALYARGQISDLASTNEMFPGSPNPIPSSFYGYFFQGAYQLWEHGDYRFNPFARYEVYNLGASYAGTAGPDIPAGLVPMSPAPGDFGYWPKNFDRVWTVGANFYLGPHVVLKADYQWFHDNEDFKRFNLGLGVAF